MTPAPRRRNRPVRAPTDLIATRGGGDLPSVAPHSLQRIGIRADGVYDGSSSERSAHRETPDRVVPRALATNRGRKQQPGLAVGTGYCFTDDGRRLVRRASAC